MDLFISLSLLIAISLIFLCVQRDKLVNTAAFRKALSNFVIAVIAHNPAVELFTMVPPGIWGIFFRVLAYIFIVLSFRQLCLAFGAPLEETVPPPAKSP
jgi:hypothetical protein